MRTCRKTKMDELKAFSYFSSLSNISKKIAQHEKSLIKYLGNKWTEYSPEQQEELLNDLCVPYSIRQLYPVDVHGHDGADDKNEDLKQYWPTLRLSSGEKIMVDENDIWTWRDEHSGPFSWKSRSQQDLTLLDFDSENLTKQHNKCLKSETEKQEAEQVIKKYQHFCLNSSSWTQEVLEEFSGCGWQELQTPVHSPSLSASVMESALEEVNAGFEGSTDDLSPASPSHGALPSSPEEVFEDALTAKESEMQVSAAKSNKGKKSISPNKSPLSGHLKKEVKGKAYTDASQELLLSDAKDEERSAFSNPVMEVVWSNFVGQTSTDSDDEIKQATPASKQMQSPAKEPDAMVMDRGENSKASAESTPDHSTQLLKPSSADLVEAEKEEVLYVVAGQAGVLMPAENSSSTDEVDLPKTGFDFLDNW